MGFEIESSGDFPKTRAWLERLRSDDIYDPLDALAQEGVAALEAATPKKTGLTAASWDYKVERQPGFARISWFNNNEVAGTSVAILLQYGHGTGTGGYVQGEDYINPAMAPLFDAIKKAVMEEVSG